MVGWRPVQDELSNDYDVIAIDLPGSTLPALPAGVAVPRRPWRMPLKASWTGSAWSSSTSPGTPGARVASRMPSGAAPIRSSRSPPTGWASIGASPPGGGTAERTSPGHAACPHRHSSGCHGSRTVAVLRHGAELSLAVARRRCRAAAAGLCRGAGVSGDRPGGHVRCPDAARAHHLPGPSLLQGTNDPLVSMQSPRFLAFVRHAQLRWLPGLSHVPISDDPQLVASLMLRFLKTATDKREQDRRLPPQ